MADPLIEVGHLLRSYFDGLHFGDVETLKRVFHPRAIYACASEGPLTALTMDAYFPIVAARPSPASRNETRSDEIVSVEFAGPVTALAKVRCSIGEKRFTDFLSLVRIDGDWKIVAKVFHFDLVP